MKVLRFESSNPLDKTSNYIKETIDGAFNTSRIQASCTNYATLIEPYATSENMGYTFLRSSADFQTAVNELNAHASQRSSAVQNYLK